MRRRTVTSSRDLLVTAIRLLRLQEEAIFPSKAEFVTAYDTSDKFERMSDDALLTLVQKQTFKYFWDYAHPVSGLARERLGSDETVTTGGSGFGIMCLPVGVSRGFITKYKFDCYIISIFASRKLTYR